MKTPIEPSDIRKGDLIRCVRREDVREGRVEAYADNAIHFEYGYQWITPGGSYYLLDRPKPAVELPTVPTLGWVELRHGVGSGFSRTVLDEWEVADEDCIHTVRHSRARWTTDKVTAFTPATAVPTEALDALRDELTSTTPPDSTDEQNWQHLGQMVHTFLAAVDEAQR